MSDPRPWFANDAGTEAKRHAPATARNREPILAILRDILPDSGLALEIASGSGEHVVAFAEAFPDLAWQPSDPDPRCRASIAAWVAESGLPNVAPPLDLDAAAPDRWPVERADAILCINMVHISPWAASEGLMAGAGRLLGTGGLLFLYGPFRQAGVELAPSNAEFDRFLKARDPAWGLRQVDEIAREAEKAGLALAEVRPMPANNLSLVFRRGREGDVEKTA